MSYLMNKFDKLNDNIYIFMNENTQSPIQKMSDSPQRDQIKIPASYFMAINQLILKFIWRGKRLSRILALAFMKNKIRGLFAIQLHNLILKGYSNQENIELMKE